MMFTRFFLLLSAALLSSCVFADGSHFKRVLTIIFENTDYSKTIQQPYFTELGKQGAFFADFHGEGHPSQGNYIALTAGDLLGVTSDKNYNLNSSHIGDLIENSGRHWKLYAEGYPGNCYLSDKGDYARKHNPFISFVDVQKKPELCAQIINASQFDSDFSSNTLPEYMMYIPDLKNDGHDTGVAYADKWLDKSFRKYFSNPDFMKDTIVILTFDEDSGSKINKIYTVIFGSGVKSGFSVPERHDHYSLLRMIEDEWSLGSLGRNDALAPVITNLWK